MSYIFTVLFAMHPLAPMVFLVVMANGLLAPAIYSAVAKLPYSIGAIRQRAISGALGAKYAYYSWLCFLAVVAALLLAMLVNAIH